MPLSDHEQRLLQQMEQALYAEDPKFAEGLRKTRSAQMDKGRFAIGVGGILVGMAILIGGVATTIIVVGVIGFLAMIAGSFVAYRAWNGNAEKTEEDPDAESAPGAAAPKAKKKTAKPADGNGFMGRMEDRWRRRKEQGGSF